MLMSDANKGLFGRKRGVGAMRGLISLAVIFFVALSAQASAKKKNLGEKITVLCVGDITDKGSKDKSIPAATKFLSGIRLKNGWAIPHRCI